MKQALTLRFISCCPQKSEQVEVDLKRPWIKIESAPAPSTSLAPPTWLRRQQQTHPNTELGTGSRPSALEYKQAQRQMTGRDGFEVSFQRVGFRTGVERLLAESKYFMVDGILG